MAMKPRPPETLPTDAEARTRAAELQARWGEAEPSQAIAAAAEAFPGRVAAVSSFGADSAVLLHLIAQVDKSLPIVFLETGKHFGETIEYRDALLADLGLRNLAIVEPEPAALSLADPRGDLFGTDTEACCAVRKVEPMARGVAPYAAWFTGRKRFQAATRAALPVFEAVGARLRINPLAQWDAERLARYAEEHGLRPNPLVPYGYLSIGCFPCTRPVAPGEDARAGRWAGQAKTECGIHLGGLSRSLTAASQ